MARSTPEDKYTLVTGLKEIGHVVAVTGDGTNDAPALKKANVGFAMGIAGTEVAKDASDIVILDDNFASIITAIKWGRNIYQNIRKFLQFQLTVNIVAMFIVFLGSVILSDPPLTSVQMLWVNLIMDTCGALALATEPANPEVLKDKPYPKNDKIINAVMWRNILGHAVYQMIVLVVILFQGKQLFGLDYQEDVKGFYHMSKRDPTCNEKVSECEMDPDLDQPIVPKLTHYTILFQSFVCMQLFNEINARKLGKKDDKEYNVFKGFLNNPLFLLILLSTFAVQTAMVQYGGPSVRTTPLTVDQHMICLAIGAYSLVHAVVIKAVIPASIFEKLAINEQPLEQGRVTFTQSIRRGSSVRHPSISAKVGD